MRIKAIRTITGPNVYSHDPVLVMTLDLEDLAGRESYEVPGFNDRLLACLPGLEEHFCGLGRRGGFVERLRGGTWFGHIVEHVALELTDALDISVNRGKTVQTDQPGQFLVVVTYKVEDGMRHLLHVAVELVQALIDDRPYPLQQKLEEGRRVVEHAAFGPSTQAIIDAARSRNIPVQPLGKGNLVRLGYGCRSLMMDASLSGRTSAVACDIASDKDLTRTLLEDAGIPVPAGRKAHTLEETLEAFHELGPPVVVKPLDGNQGKGVSLNLMSPADVRRAFEAASAYSHDVVVERMMTGRDYRVLVVNGKAVAASEKTPASVTGDGERTIGELVEVANRDPRRGDLHSKPMSRISCDAVVEAYLARDSRTLDTIPGPGERVMLRESANLSTGGEACDVTDDMHPAVAAMCERAARVVGLDVCGIDLIWPDISVERGETGGIVEVNAAPGLRMHHFPGAGKPRNVASSIIEMLYPGGSDGRIPVIAITGTNGKTTTTRMISHALSSAGVTAGMTTTDGIWIGSREIARGDTTGPWSARVVLSDTTVQAAVLETARGGIVRAGLGWDWADVAVFTNIEPDHLGQDGIDTVEDILRIKTLVAERVREGGTIILNADDERLCSLPDNRRVSSLRRDFVYFSISLNNLVLQHHITHGGTAYAVKGDWIEEHRGALSRRIARVSDLACTFNGTADFQVSNVLACVAACRAYGLEPETVAAALATFDNGRQNDGRVNVYEYRDSVVVLDYGHNAHAIEAIARMVERWGVRRVTAVLGLPGDRTDELIADAACTAARHFHSIIVREDKDLRGRQRGELPRLMVTSIFDSIPEAELFVEHDEQRALSVALSRLGPGEAAVCFCEHQHETAEWLKAHGATLCSDPGRIREMILRADSVPA